MAQKKISTNSDVELELILLTNEGRIKIENEESITIDDIIDPNTNYVKVRVRQNKDGQEFIAYFNGDTDSEAQNCYVGEKTYNELNVPVLVITIPSGTFTENGYLWVAIETREESDYFEDNYKNTEGLFEKTEVNYVAQ
jgi:hypothetical protein